MADQTERSNINSISTHAHVLFSIYTLPRYLFARCRLVTGKRPPPSRFNRVSVVEAFDTPSLSLMAPQIGGNFVIAAQSCVWYTIELK